MYRETKIIYRKRLCDALACIFVAFPFVEADVGIDDACGSLADLCANAGARDDLVVAIGAAGAVPGIISVLELSLDESRVC